MNNRINPYRNSLTPSFRKPTQRSEGAAGEARPPQEAAAQATAPAKPEQLAGLSRVEQRMIDRYFPASETMTLRLYGANRHTQTINPGAVGGHLDVEG